VATSLLKRSASPPTTKPVAVLRTLSVSSSLFMPVGRPVNATLLTAPVRVLVARYGAVMRQVVPPSGDAQNVLPRSVRQMT
jgi:hypothetical protein